MFFFIVSALFYFVFSRELPLAWQLTRKDMIKEHRQNNKEQTIL